MKFILVALLLLIGSCSSVDKKESIKTSQNTIENETFDLPKYIGHIKQKYKTNNQQNLCIDSIIEDKKFVTNMSVKVSTYLKSNPSIKNRRISSELLNDQDFRRDILQPISEEIGLKCFQLFIKYK